MKGNKDFDKSSTAPYERIGELENENFLLKEKIDLLEIQTKVAFLFILSRNQCIEPRST